MTLDGRRNIVLDGLPLCVRSAGVASYTRSLASSLAQIAEGETYTLLCPRGPGFADPQLAPSHQAHIQLTRSYAYPLVMDHPAPLVSGLLSLESLVDSPDLFHATAYALPRRRNCPTVCTVHDLALLRFPEFGTARMRSLVERTVDSLDRVDLVIAVSESTKHDLIELCSVREDRIRVVHNGVSTHFAPPTTVAPGKQATIPYLLHVGTIEPRKNLRTLLDAFRELTTTTELPHHLVLAGDQGWGDENLEDYARKLGIADRVSFAGHVDQRELPGLYAGADAFVYPSRYEGFGLPLLEAMSCGTPVTCSNRPALSEIAGSAALLFDPEDPGSICDRLSTILEDQELRSDLRERGLARAARFSWEASAQQTLGVYRELL